MGESLGIRGLALLLVPCDLGEGLNPFWTCFPSAYFVRLPGLTGVRPSEGLRRCTPMCHGGPVGGATAGSEGPRQGDSITPLYRPGTEVKRTHWSVPSQEGTEQEPKFTSCKPPIPDPLETISDGSFFRLMFLPAG